MSDSALEQAGFVLFDEQMPSGELDDMREELRRVLELRAAEMQRNRVVARMAGTGHHLLERDSPFLDWLSRFARSAVLGAIESALEGKAVLNTFGAVDNRKHGDQYVAEIHRDVRTFTRDQRLMMQVLLTLDEFSPETGAIWLLPGSHKEPGKPGADAFFADAIQLSAQAGRVLLFDSRLWHAAGVNRTDRPRRALTIAFTRPFMKPQFDYCRYLGEAYVETLPEATQQLLGYFARIPSTLEEWYRPPERRFYRAGQG